MDEDKNSYEDPENVTELLAELRTIENKYKLQTFIERVFPNWIYASVDSYTCDYWPLQESWKKICEMNGTTQKKILVVEKIVYSNRNELLISFCEKLTRMGYSVRAKDEVHLCDICKRAMFSKERWNTINGRGFMIPDEWSPLCTMCSFTLKET
jgi:hypothetical protein